MSDIDPTKLKHRELLYLIYQDVAHIKKEAAKAEEARLAKDKTQDEWIGTLSTRVRKLEHWRTAVLGGAAVVGLLFKDKFPKVAALLGSLDAGK